MCVKVEKIKRGMSTSKRGKEARSSPKTIAEKKGRWETKRSFPSTSVKKKMEYPKKAENKRSGVWKKGQFTDVWGEPFI